MNEKSKKILISQLRNELTEAEVYARLAKLEKNTKNKELLTRISNDEASHARVIENILGCSSSPSTFKINWIVFCARIFGITFTLKLMERGENTAGKTYRAILDEYPQLATIAEDENHHEAELIEMLDDEHLNNIGAIVLGLNDALVELTGALAGFTFAIGNSIQIAKLGLITGLAAAMSMAASAFLSARVSEHTSGDANNALKTATYTGIAYVITVLLLVAPFAFISNATAALMTMLLSAISIIAFFNFYISVSKGRSFFRGFFTMASISTAVALISYAFGYFLR